MLRPQAAMGVPPISRVFQQIAAKGSGGIKGRMNSPWHMDKKELPRKLHFCIFQFEVCIGVDA